MEFLNINNISLIGNSSTLNSSELQIEYLKEQGCNLQIDTIVNESGKYLCYHQATTIEAIKMYWVELTLILIVTTLIGNKVTSYIIKKYKTKKEIK